VQPQSPNPEPRTPNPAVYVLVGATASGKTEAAVELAGLLGAELASMDSMKVYRGMDIGTAKPTATERVGVGWHLLDLVEPTEEFNVGKWLAAADAAIAEAAGRGVSLVFEGGSPLYCRALLYGLFAGPPRSPELRAELRARAAAEGVEKLHAELAAVDPEAARRIQKRDLRRIERALEVYHLTGRPISGEQRQFGRPRPGFDFRLAGIARDRMVLYARFDARVEAMMAAGLREEVGALRARHGDLSREAMQALGYREFTRHLTGEITLEAAVYLAKRNTRHFARRQISGFRRIPGIAWFAPQPGETAGELSRRIAGKLRQQ